jgi:hypothetical protein
MNESRLRIRREKREGGEQEFEGRSDIDRFRDISADFGTNLKVIGAYELALAILSSGSMTSKAIELLNWCGCVAPAHNQLCNALQRIGEVIITMAKKSCSGALNRLPVGCVISFDGSWEHRRNSHRCFVDVCCQNTGQVIAYAIISNLIPEDRPEYCKIPQNMEVAGMKMLLPQLVSHPEICAYCHDNDAKTRKLIRESGWGIEEYLDPGHAMKSFERTLNKYPALKEIAESLRKFMKRLLHWSDVSIEEKECAWMNAYDHYCGCHEKCPFEHKDKGCWTPMQQPEVQKVLRDFLGETKPILAKCKSEFSTQTNESLHRLKEKYATKDIKWNSTWEARMACAVLDRNLPFWKLKLYRLLALPKLPPGALIQRIVAERDRITKNFNKSSASKHLRRTITNRLNSMANRRLGAIDYKKNPYYKK